MRRRALTVSAAALACVFIPTAFAKSDAPYLPQYILNARTVAVVIETEAGVSVRDPNGNQTARKDVETALLKWGRFQPIMNGETANGKKRPVQVRYSLPAIRSFKA